MKRTGPSERHFATPASSTSDTIDSAKEARGASSQDQEAHVEKVTVYSKPLPGTGRSMLPDSRYDAAPDGSGRREHYTGRGQQPSFEFADIDDEQVLKVEADQRLAMQPVSSVKPRQTEEARRLLEIARAIKEMMEGEVASVLKELARLAAQDGAGQSDVQEAKKGFSLFIKHFQQAKLAAGNGNGKQLTEALTSALAELARLVGPSGDKCTGQAWASRAFRTGLQPGLQTLAAACSAWAGLDNPLSRQVPATDRGASDSHDRTGTEEARARAVSSPAPVRPSQERERARSLTSPIPSSGTIPSSMVGTSQAPTHSVETLKSPSGPGRKLKAFFSRSSEARTRKTTAGSEPGSPLSRSSAERSTSTSNTATTSTRPASLSRADKLRDAND